MAKQMYQTMTEAEKIKFLGISGKQPYKYEGHSLRPLKGVGKNWCPKCGLVALNNAISHWCIDKGCNYSDHPQYKTKVKKLTKMRW